MTMKLAIGATFLLASFTLGLGEVALPVGALARNSKTGYYDQYVSKGCYRDGKRHRIMSRRMKSGHMCTEICYEWCKDAGYTYFGTQHGDECWCDNHPDLYANGGKVSPSECDKPCRGGKGERCGGRDRMSVYKMTKKDDDRKNDNDSREKDSSDDSSSDDYHKDDDHHKKDNDSSSDDSSDYHKDDDYRKKDNDGSSDDSSDDYHHKDDDYHKNGKDRKGDDSSDDSSED